MSEDPRIVAALRRLAKRRESASHEMENRLGPCLCIFCELTRTLSAPLPAVPAAPAAAATCRACGASLIEQTATHCWPRCAAPSESGAAPAQREEPTPTREDADEP